jgi:uncharacterized protein YdbL (DUF1318 family)
MIRLFSMTIALLLLAAQASAGPLEDAKRAGLVGERADGYVGTPKPSDEGRRLADEVNAKRREAYRDIGARNGATPGAVGALTGKRLIEQSPPGSWYMDEHGGWKRK